MKNLQISDNDLIGNRFNGHDLHLYLRKRGIISDQLVRTKRSNDPDTYEVGGSVEVVDPCNEMIRRVEKRYGTHSFHYPYSFSIFSDPLFLNADSVHYHLIHNYFFNLSLLPMLSSLKPSILSIHEPFFTTGHCIYPLDCDRWKTGCGNCPYVNLNFALEMDASAINWDMKRDIFARSRLDLIVYSKYMLDWVKQSPILSHLDVHQLRFGIDLERFSPADPTEARKRWGIPQENLVLCFRSDRSAFKGLEYIKEALNRLSADVPITLLGVGEKNLMNSFRDRYHVVDSDWVYDDNALLDVYRAGDIFLMPSKAEAFGMMAMEAMACGKPSIVFDGTSLPEAVFAPEGGIAVPQGDVGAFTREIEDLIVNKERRLKLGTQARKLVEQYYDKDDYVSSMIDLYREVIAKRTTGERAKFILDQMRNVKLPQKSKTKKAQATTAESKSMVEFDPCAEMVHFLPSLYYKAYYRARSQRQLKYLSANFIKPAIRSSWKAMKTTRGFVKRFLF